MTKLSMSRNRIVVVLVAVIAMVVGGLVAINPTARAATGFSFAFSPSATTVKTAGGAGSPNLSFDYSFTCTTGVSACNGATMTIDIPDAAFQINSDGSRTLIAQPSHVHPSVSMATVKPGDTTVTLTVNGNLTNRQAAAKISFTTTAQKSTPGTQQINAVAKFNGETENQSATVTVTGTPNSTLSKNAAAAFGDGARLGENIQYSLSFARPNFNEDTQGSTGSFVDRLPAGTEFVGFYTTGTNVSYRMIKNLAYNSGNHTITGTIDRDAANTMWNQFGGAIQLTYVLRVVDPTKFPTSAGTPPRPITNDVTWTTTSFDGKIKQDLKATRTLPYTEAPRPAGSVSKKPYGNYSVNQNYSTVQWLVEMANNVAPTAGTENVMTVVDTPENYLNSGINPFSPETVSIMSQPLGLTAVDSAYVQVTPRWRVTFTYSDGTSQTVEKAANTSGTITSPRAAEYRTVKATSIKIEVFDAPVGQYGFVIAGRAAVPEGQPSGGTYKVGNTATASINGEARGTSLATVPTSTAMPATAVTIAAVANPGPIWGGVTPLPLQTREKFPLQVTVTNRNDASAPAEGRPTVYLTASPGMKIDYSNPRWYYQGGAYATIDGVRTLYPIAPTDWVFEDLGYTAPNGGHMVKMSLRPGLTIPDTRPYDARYIGVTVDAVLDPTPAKPLQAGTFNSTDLRNPTAAFGATVYEQDQANWYQGTTTKLDTADVDRDGNTTEKAQTSTQSYVIPAYVVTRLEKTAQGDVNRELGEGFTVNGGLIRNEGTFRITAGSLGTEPLQSVVVYDFLPWDKPRGGTTNLNQFKMNTTMTGPVINTDGAKYIARYSTSLDPCTPELGTAACPGGAAMDSTFVTANQVSDWSVIRTIRIEFIGTVTDDYNFDIPVEHPPTRNDGGILRRGDEAINRTLMGATKADGTRLAAVGPVEAKLTYRPALFVDKQVDTPRADISDTLRGTTPPLVAKGEELTYTVRAVNVARSTDIENVWVEDDLPEGLEILEASATIGTFDVKTGYWDIGTLKRTAWDRVADPNRRDLSGPNIGVLTIRARATADISTTTVNKARITVAADSESLAAAVNNDTLCVPHQGFLTDCDSVVVEGDAMTATLSGNYFRDVQPDGQPGSNERDAADVPKADQPVILHYERGDGPAWLDAGGNEITTASTTSDAHGDYIFTGLVGGQYRVEFGTRAPLPWVTPNVGDEATDSDAIPTADPTTALTEIYAVPNDGAVANVDAGVRGNRAAIAGTIWFDRNDDSGHDLTEPPAAGIPVTVELYRDGVLVATQETTTGHYLFEDLDAGNYQVKVIVPDEWRITANPDGQANELVEANVPAGNEGGSQAIVLDWGVNTDRDVPINNTSVIAGHYFIDDDRDGIVEGSALPVPRGLVRLIRVEDDGTRTDLAVTTVDTKGAYAFRALAPARYAVEFIRPDGYVFSAKAGSGNLADPQLSDVDPATGTTVDFPLTGNTSVVNVDAVVNNVLTISGTVFDDANQDGQLAGASPVAGSVVRLLHEDGRPVDNIDPVTVGADGRYAFVDIPADTFGYRIGVQPPAGAIITPRTGEADTLTQPGLNDIDPATGQSRLIPAVEGQDVINVDAGISNTGVLSGHVYVETDADGSVIGEQAPGLAGAYAVINVDGVTWTAPVDRDTGEYVFTGVPSGEYEVRIALPAGYVLSAQSGDPANPSEAGLNNFDPALMTVAATVTAGQRTENVDAVAHGQGSVTGFVFEESDADGDVATNSAGRMSGVNVTLLNAAGNQVADAVTDSDGSYTFSGVAAGEGYTVAFTAPDGYRISAPGAQNLADPATGRTAPFAVSANRIAVDIDAVMHAPGSISGRVVLEGDTDGDVRAGEVIGVGTTVRLLDPDGNPALDINGQPITTTTGADGTYTFTGVTQGSYLVEVVLPANQRFSRQAGAGDLAAPDLSDVDPATGRVAVEILAGGSATNVDAVTHGLGGVSGRLVAERDADGTVAAGDEVSPLEGVTVTLTAADGTALSTTTDADGNYGFEDVPAGEYTVAFTDLPAGYQFSPQTGTPADLNQPNFNDVDPATGQVTVTVIRDDVTAAVNVDAIVHGNSSIAGRYFEDYNADAQGDGDVGVEGVRVELFDADGKLIATTTTAADGTYSFAHVAGAGAYRVRFATPAGHAATTPTTVDVSVENNGVTNEINAGATRSGLITGAVTLDPLASGKIDKAAGIAGILAVLLNQDGTPALDRDGNEITTLTDAQGRYQLRAQAGTYRVGLRLTADQNYQASPRPADWESVYDGGESDLLPGTMNTAAVAVTAGAVVPDIDAALVGTPGDISGRVVGEFDADGRVDQGYTAPVAGATVRLLDADGNEVATTTSAADGTYSFRGVRPGTYRVAMALPAGYQFSARAGGADVQAPDLSDVDPATGEVAVTLPAAGALANVDAVARVATAVSGTVITDNNANGVRDTGDTGRTGVTVELLDAQGNVVETVETDVEGNYRFAGVLPGTYQLRFAAPDGTVISPQGADNVADANGVVPLTVKFDDVTGVNAAVTLGIGTVSGTIWNDANSDGVLAGAGEGGLDGVKVELLDSANQVINTATTDSAGRYSFAGVAPGTYQVRVNTPSGYKLTSDPDGTVTPSTTFEVTVARDSAAPDTNFGFVLAATSGTVTGEVFGDTDGDGVRDGDERGLGGVVVQLVDAAGKVVATATTAADGTYSLAAEAGEYTVRVALGSGQQVTTGTEHAVAIVAGEEAAVDEFGVAAAAVPTVTVTVTETSGVPVTETETATATATATPAPGETVTETVTVTETPDPVPTTPSTPTTEPLPGSSSDIGLCVAGSTALLLLIPLGAMVAVNAPMPPGMQQALNSTMAEFNGQVAQFNDQTGLGELGNQVGGQVNAATPDWVRQLQGQTSQINAELNKFGMDNRPLIQGGAALLAGILLAGLVYSLCAPGTGSSDGSSDGSSADPLSADPELSSDLGLLSSGSSGSSG